MDAMESFYSALSETGRVVYLTAILTVVEYSMFGLHTILFPLSALLILQRPHNSRAKKCIFMASTVLYLASASHFAGYVMRQVLEIRNLLLDASSLSLDARLQRQSDKFKLWKAILLDWNQSTVFIVADTLAMWRAWVLYPDKKALKVFMAFVVCANAVMSLSGMIYYYTSYARHAPVLQSSVNIAAIFLSFFTNLSATVAIAWRARQHFSQWNQWRPRVLRQKSRVITILVLLIETGGALCIVQLTMAILTLFHPEHHPYTPFYCAFELIIELAFNLVAILPTLLIIVLHSERFSVLSYTDKTINFVDPETVRFSSTQPISPTVDSALSKSETSR